MEEFTSANGAVMRTKTWIAAAALLLLPACAQLSLGTNEDANVVRWGTSFVPNDVPQRTTLASSLVPSESCAQAGNSNSAAAAIQVFVRMTAPLADVNSSIITGAPPDNCQPG